MKPISSTSDQSSLSFSPLKLTAGTQILHYESDTKTLKELDIKESILIQVSHTGVPSNTPGTPTSPSLLPAPKRKCTPHSVLVKLEAIEVLLRLATVVQQDNNEFIATKIWRLLGILPTSPKEVVRAACAISQYTRDWETFFGKFVYVIAVPNLMILFY